MSAPGGQAGAGAGAGAGGGAAAGQAPPAPEAYAPAGHALRVFCDQGHPLTGLFVVWALRPPQPAAGGGASSPEADIMKVADRHEPPPGRFAPGFVDKGGFLQPMFQDVNPWHDIWSDRRPQTYKLQPDRKVHLIPLRHPSAALARGLAAWLNGDRKKPFDFAPWGGADAFGGAGASPEKLATELDVTTTPPPKVKPAGGGDQELYLAVPEKTKPEPYWPRGHALYGGWTLYLDMPNGACRTVAAEVERLQKHLGILRFPIGIQERPYWPEPRTDSLPTGNLGIFEMRTAGALVRFQEHAAAGRAFKLTPEAKGEVHGKLLQDPGKPREPATSAYLGAETWACLLGNEIGPKPASPAAGSAAGSSSSGGAAPPGGAAAGPPGILPEIDAKDVLRRHAWGVADAATGACLETWLKSGYRKPGQILLAIRGPPSAGRIALREEAAVQVEGWRQLAKACGVAYAKVPHALPSGHSYRDISGIARGQKGMLNNSIHKTGLAIDFWTAYVKPGADWPMRMEQRFSRPGNDPAQAQRTQLRTAEREKATATASREADEKLRKAKGAPAPTALPAQPPPDTAEGARARSTVATGKADTERERAQKALAGAGTDATKKAKASELLASTVALDDAQLAALDAEIDLLRRLIADIESKMQKVKLGYRMHFCLYGHSTLDLFGKDAGTAEAELTKGLGGFGGELRTHLESFFPKPLAAQAQDWLRLVGLKTYLNPAAVLKRLPERHDLRVKTLFRAAIRAFLPDPLEPDGGSSWDKALVASPTLKVPLLLKPRRPEEKDVDCEVDKAGATPAKLEPYTDGTARSYVNLSHLGWCCDMYGIGTAGTDWKQDSAKFEVSAAFSALAAQVKETASHEQAKVEPVVVVRAKAPIAALTPDKLDVDFLVAWADALKDLAIVGSGKKKAPSACFRVKGSRLVFRLPSPELASDGDRLVAALKGKLAKGRFVVLDPGKETGLGELPAAGALSGSDLATKLDAAGKAFKERVEKFRKAAEEAKKQADEAKKAGKPPPRPPKVPEKPPEADPVKMDRSWFEVTLQPLFEKGVVPAAGLANVILQPGDVVQVAAPGVPRTLEWWHHQGLAARGIPWEKLVEEIGFSERILLASDPPEQDGGDWDGRGIGYTKSELESLAGGITSLDEPTNVWDPPPAGW